MIGYSEQDAWSYRAGAQLEAARWLEAEHTQVYASTGLHVLRSRTDDEIRLGPAWRAAAGVRFAAGGNGYLGFEPLAIERLPNGPGP